MIIRQIYLYPTRVLRGHLSAFGRLAAVFGLVATMTGCGFVGNLLSNPRVSDADNDQVITIDDSIFALSGKIQDDLEDSAGQTFRQYTLSGASLSGGDAIATSVVNQYAMAWSDNPDIEVVVMNGGANVISAGRDENGVPLPWWLMTQSPFLVLQGCKLNLPASFSI